MNTTVLKLTGVRRSYPGESPVHALRGIDLTVAEGELIAVTGPSGSGKTTLLHIAGTLDRPTSGTVRVAGHDLAALSDRRLATLRAHHIGFIFQSFFLAEHQSVLDNVADGLLYAGTEASVRRRLAAEALERVGLSHRMAFRPTKLSGGERQRVAIARALIGPPAIILADEPTGNLDTATSAGIVDLLHELNADGATIVVITHDRDLAADLPRLVEMRDGQILADTGPGTGLEGP
jgi:putative ABC transport system ATP-binding protein